MMQQIESLEENKNKWKYAIVSIIVQAFCKQKIKNKRHDDIWTFLIHSFYSFGSIWSTNTVRNLFENATWQFALFILNYSIKPW